MGTEAYRTYFWADSTKLFKALGSYPKGPCTQIVYTLAPKYLYSDYFKDKVYTIWVHGPLGFV